MRFKPLRPYTEFLIVPLDVGGDPGTIHRNIVVVDPILPRHHRIEALGVEIAIVDLMPPGAQGPDQLRMQGGGETRLNRVSEQHQNAHANSALRRARPCLEDGKEEVLAGDEIKLRVPDLPGEVDRLVEFGLSRARGERPRRNRVGEEGKEVASAHWESYRIGYFTEEAGRSADLEPSSECFSTQAGQISRFECSLFGDAAHDHFRVEVAVALRACHFDHAQRRVVAHAIGADHDLVRVAGRLHVTDERPHARTLRAA